MTAPATCPWTGQPFEAKPAKGNRPAKKFATPDARAEAHKAARLYAENLIACGFLTWAAVRRWYEGRTDEIPPYTAPGGTGTDSKAGVAET